MKKKYPIKMVNNKIIPTQKINDNKLKNEIENFKFFVQYGSFKIQMIIKKGILNTI